MSLRKRLDRLEKQVGRAGPVSPTEVRAANGRHEAYARTILAERATAIFRRRGEEPPEWCEGVPSAVEPYPPEQQARDREVLALDRAARGIVVEGAKEEFARRLDTIAARKQMARERGLGA